MTLQDVRTELAAMWDVGMISLNKRDRATIYVDEHAAEVEEYLISMSVSETADLVLQLIGD